MTGLRSTGAIVRGFRWLYAITSWLLVVAVVMQFLLAGIGVFAPVNFCNLVPNESFGCGFALHAWFGRMVLSLLFLLVLVLCFAARAPRRTTALTAALPGLFVVQGLLLLPPELGVAFRPVAAIHVVNGLLILFVGLRVAGQARQLLAELPRSQERPLPEALSRPAEGETA